MPDRTLEDFMGVRPPRPAPTPEEARRAERRAATAQMTKCTCGNVAGQGETQCGRCRNQASSLPYDVQEAARVLALIEQEVGELIAEKFGSNSEQIMCFEEVNMRLRRATRS